jgi:hypothetical protein
MYEKMRESKRMRILQAITSIKKVYQTEDWAKYKIIRDVNGVDVSSYVYFAKIDDLWKIDHY